MNNQELFDLFAKISTNANCFDREIELKKIKKQYKKSSFYKQTHYPLHTAYKIYLTSGLNTITTFFNSKLLNNLLRGNKGAILNELETIIENFDPSCLNHVFKYIEEYLDAMVAQNQDSHKELEQILLSFKESFKV